MHYPPTGHPGVGSERHRKKKAATESGLFVERYGINEYRGDAGRKA